MSISSDFLFYVCYHILTTYYNTSSGVATAVRGAGRTGRHLLGAAKERKTPKITKQIQVKIQTVSFICVCVQEKQSVTASVYLSSAIKFQKPKTKGRQIRPPLWAAKGPATPLNTSGKDISWLLTETCVCVGTRTVQSRSCARRSSMKILTPD